MITNIQTDSPEDYETDSPEDYESIESFQRWLVDEPVIRRDFEMAMKLIHERLDLLEKRAFGEVTDGDEFLANWLQRFKDAEALLDSATRGLQSARESHRPRKQVLSRSPLLYLTPRRKADVSAPASHAGNPHHTAVPGDSADRASLVGSVKNGKTPRRARADRGAR